MSNIFTLSEKLIFFAIKREYTIITSLENIDGEIKNKFKLELKCNNCNSISYKTFCSKKDNIEGKYRKCRCANKIRKLTNKCPDGYKIINQIDNKYSKYLELEKISSYYYINDEGKVISSGNGKIVIRTTTSYSSGYERFSYRINEERKNISIPTHQIVYASFGERVNEDLDFKNFHIDHIDRNKFNNNIVNLRLVTLKENQNNRSRCGRQYGLNENFYWDENTQIFYHTTGIYYKYNKDINKDVITKQYNQYNERIKLETEIYIQGEKWENIIVEDKEYKISNKGRVENIYGKTWGTISSSGYVNYNGKRMHTLVALAFLKCENDNFIVNHKDGCKVNNKVENLEWITIKENTQHAYDTNLNPNKRSIVMVDDNIIKIFESIVDGVLYIETLLGKENKYKSVRGSIESCLYANKNKTDNHKSINRKWYYNNVYYS